MIISYLEITDMPSCNNKIVQFLAHPVEPFTYNIVLCYTQKQSCKKEVFIISWYGIQSKE